MNDQYKHVEKTLTPGIVVEFIQELKENNYVHCD